MVDIRAQCSYFGSSNSPSFSSSLLDAIYRSIDLGEDEAVVCREDIMKKKQNYGGDNVRGAGVLRTEEEMANFQRACMIEKWMEKKGSEKVNVRRKSGDDLKMKKSRKDRENSSSSSSDSSASGGLFSSSDAESFSAIQRPKPVRTGGFPKAKEKTGGSFEINCRGYDEPEQKPLKREGGFLKTKSRALKLYGDLKKVKQPVSPGGKLAGFLNSLFAGGNPKKHKSSAESPSLKSTNASTCSSASSFSRSCLSKTPSSRGKSSTGAKRSVRFSPVSVIVDDDSRPCEHKSFHQSEKHETPNFQLPKNNNNAESIRSMIKEELMAQAMEKHRRVENVARDLLRNYHRQNQAAECNQFEYQLDQLRKPQSIKNQVFGRDHLVEEDDDDMDDAASYASSDLFELDNLSAIGMEELPVYETTHLGTNRAIAIANALIQ